MNSFSRHPSPKSAIKVLFLGTMLIASVLLIVWFSRAPERSSGSSIALGIAAAPPTSTIPLAGKAAATSDRKAAERKHELESQSSVGASTGWKPAGASPPQPERLESHVMDRAPAATVKGSTTFRVAEDTTKNFGRDASTSATASIPDR